MDVQAVLAQSRVLGLRAEVGRRGYILTGNPRDLAAMRTSRVEAVRALAHLKTMTSDNPRQQRTLDQLNQLVAIRGAGLEQSVALAAAGRPREAARLLDSPETRAVTERLTDLVNRAGAEEARLLVIREARAQKTERLARAVLVAGALLIALLAALIVRERRQRMRSLADANRQLVRDNRRRQVAEEQLRLLADNATDAVFRMTLDGHFAYASPSVKQVFGVDPEMVIGHDIYLGVHRNDRAALKEALAALASGGQERQLLTYRVARLGAPGEWRWVESTVGLVRGADGAPAEIISSLRDVTSHKRLEAELEAARVRAESAAHAKSSFLADMSHEIRTPMNGVIGFTELLLTGDLTPDQRHQVELIADSGRAMLRLLNDILDWSKVEAGQMRIAHEPFDLHHAIRACAHLVAPAIEQKRLTLHLDVAAALPKLVCGDGLRLRQVLLNLLGNAVKFTQAGTIAVRAVPVDGADGPEMAISVHDTGIGIPADRRDAIFEAFVQAEISTAARFGGTGLGLPISARLATLMGGRLTLATSDGPGACFTLTLPLVPGDAENCGAAAEQPRTPPVRVDGRLPLRVLVAEDHDVNQLLIGAMLRQLGCAAEIVPDGAAAVASVAAARAAGEPYDVLLMDMQMPVMDGPAAARRLRADGISAAALPIVALTANAYADDVALCLAAGMQAHLAKPVSLAALEGALRQWSRFTPVAAAPAKGPSASVRARYEQRRAETLAAVDALVREGRFEEAELGTVAALLHKLAGTAAMFGEAPLGDRARDLEEGLARWPTAERPAHVRAAAAGLADAKTAASRG